jgi:hypothetical protein
MSDKKYVIIETVATFKMQYAIPVEDLSDEELSDKTAIEYASDSVVCEEVNEIGQSYLGEQIVNSLILNKEDTLAKFDKVNEYAKDWDDDKKMNLINKWKIK